MTDRQPHLDLEIFGKSCKACLVPTPSLNVPWRWRWRWGCSKKSGSEGPHKRLCVAFMCQWQC